MKDSLFSENSFIVDRNWQKINPNDQLTISINQAVQFISVMYQEHDKLKSNSQIPHQRPNMLELQTKIHNFVLKYIQQKELTFLKKREVPFVRQSQYCFDLRDCLEVWRWLNEDMASSHQNNNMVEESLEINEFEIARNPEKVSLKKGQGNQKGKKQFYQLSLNQQQEVMKKSLEMFYMYKHQCKIIFTHYCRFIIENEHKRTFTFDDVAPSLQTMNINRFMHFCRDFDLIKLVQFKRKTEQNHKINKQTLTAIFKKTGHLQKYLNFDGFLICLVKIAIKIHQNFDPRSLIQIELLLTNLQVKYHHDFIKKLESLNIKYSPTDFYNCYKDIIKKVSFKVQKYKNQFHKTNTESNKSLLYQPFMSENLKDIRSHSQNIESLSKKQSLPNLKKISQNLQANQVHKLTKRKKSLPILPSISDNKFFKPIQHNNHLNTYRNYLKQTEQTSSVFKNRITGYSNINDLQKSKKPFHMLENPEYVSQSSLRHIISEARQKLNQQNFITKTHNDEIFSKNQLKQETIKTAEINFTKSQTQLQLREEKAKIVQSLKTKVDLKDNDSILRHHLQQEEGKNNQVVNRQVENLKSK